MLRGIYSVANAMETAARNQEIVSENLVQATTPGYRRQGLLYEASSAPMLAGGGGGTAPRSGMSAGPSGGQSSFVYFEPGPLQQTNNPLDLAVSGNAFFVVEGPNGPMYTRNGSFEQGPGGELRTRGGGYRVSGEGGAITIPPDAASLTVGSDGTITANGAQVGRLRLATFAQPETLRRVGTTLFQGDAPQTPLPDAVKIEQGYREGSNVQPVQEMVSMMLGMRYYEAAGKALQALSDALSQNTRPSAS
jgi:flagellar basal-body rod protein FlgF